MVAMIVGCALPCAADSIAVDYSAAITLNTGNREFAQADGSEHLAELTYAIDIWSDSPEVNQSLSDTLDRRMMALRLRRDYLSDLFDARAGLHHRSLRYRCVADGAGNIYQ